MRDGATWVRVFAIAALFLEPVACLRHVMPFCKVIPIPPDDSRSERVSLPLDAASGAKLTRALTYGLNRNNERDDVGAVANAAAQYKGLIALLSDPNHPSLQDLRGQAFQKWFGGSLIFAVVDARDQSTPVQDGPVAANDGAYWWIFYRRQDQLTAVMIAKINACQNLIEARR